MMAKARTTLMVVGGDNTVDKQDVTNTHWPLSGMLSIVGERRCPRDAEKQHMLFYPFQSWRSTFIQLATDLNRLDDLLFRLEWNEDGIGRAGVLMIDKKFFMALYGPINTHIAVEVRRTNKPIRHGTAGVWSTEKRHAILTNAGYRVPPKSPRT